MNARKFLGSMAGHLVRALLNSVFCKIEEADHQSGSSVKDNRRIKKGSNTVGLVALRAPLRLESMTLLWPDLHSCNFFSTILSSCFAVVEKQIVGFKYSWKCDKYMNKQLHDHPMWY